MYLCLRRFSFMRGNTWGKVFQVHTFGESHGPAIGVLIDGCPAGMPLDFEQIQHELSRRRPGQSALTTDRNEADWFECLSGVLNGVTLGTPIMLTLKNKDSRSADYDALKDVYRPSHADYTWEKKFGIRDVRGGGRSSARETAARVAAGAIARQILRHQGVEILAWVSQIGPILMSDSLLPDKVDSIDASLVRCPDPDASARMEALLTQLKAEGDSTGGVIACRITGCPPGWGEPVFDKLHADLAKGMLSINACKGFEIGSGFSGVALRGSEHNDPFVMEAGQVRTTHNQSGGVQGGITNGMPIHFRVAFKPVATIRKSQSTLNKAGEQIELEAAGRHDPCVVPRAVPIVEAMAALTLLDHSLRQRTASGY